MGPIPRWVVALVLGGSFLASFTLYLLAVFVIALVEDVLR